MDFLMFVLLLIFIFVAVGLGAIPGALAKRKHRSRDLWRVSGAFGFPIALVGIFCFRNLEQIPGDQKAAYKLKEKIVLLVILGLWVVMVITRIQMAK